jgi:hypothetical protein
MPQPVAQIAGLYLREVHEERFLARGSEPGRASRRPRCVHVSHSFFAGLLQRSQSGLQLPGETGVLPFCSSDWNHK